MTNAERYVHDLSVRILRDYGLKDTPVEFSNRAQRSRGGLVHLRYSRDSVARRMTNGYSEYPTVAKALGWRAEEGLSEIVDGEAALHALTLHETAHAIQYARGLRKYGDAHGDGFIKCLRELWEKYPHPKVIMSTKPEQPKGCIPRSRQYWLDVYSVGDVVEWTDYNDGSYHSGTIMQFNTKTVKIRGLGGDYIYNFYYTSHDYYQVRKFEIDIDDLFD